MGLRGLVEVAEAVQAGDSGFGDVLDDGSVHARAAEDDHERTLMRRYVWNSIWKSKLSDPSFLTHMLVSRPVLVSVML